ncbi:hypothetical protein LE190_10860 [Massilia oculi]|uniref:Uncharacterized protein n=1 Tax=Massilia hydrophila TaxID=3044279 RepID=A0ABS7YBT1_9BURK|nr:hypothetical protein [Massilia oculi]MCA1856416.1 hypothetical protein [Massilia oculi]
MSNNEGSLFDAKVSELAAEKIEENAHESGTCSAKLGVPLDFSVAVHELLSRAESDPASAMKLLEMLAKDLRARTLPNRMLAGYVADAIEAAAAKPTTYQARALTDELHLTSQDRRPAHSWLEIGHAMHMLISEGSSQTKAKLEVAVEYHIDEGTALKYYKQYVAAKQRHDSIE